MAHANEKVAAAFNELADLIELSGGDRFKVLAYRRVAAEVEAMVSDVSIMDDSQIAAIRGVGKATASKIRELLETGTMRKLFEIRASVPPSLLELTALPGLGPKTVMQLYRATGIASIEELQRALERGQLRTIKGLGPKTERRISESIATMGSGPKRWSLEEALLIAERITAQLDATGYASQVMVAGSLRRMKESIGDIDILVASDNPSGSMSTFVELDEVERVVASGTTKSSVIVGRGLQVDLRVVKAEEMGAAAQYFTGSKEHNVRVREIAVKAKMKLSEYGLEKVDGGSRVAGSAETEIYDALGLQFPHPAIRENRGEIEAAIEGVLPSLLSIEDVRGDLHTHSTYSDGVGTMEEMIDAASKRGYEYFAITDHGGSTHVRSVRPELIPRQSEELSRLRIRYPGMRILHGVEMDIGIDGELIFPDASLATFDLVIASIHDHFELPAHEMTRRIIRAIEHPLVNIVAHPTARRIGKRPGVSFDLDQVFAAAAANHVALEVNSTPSRLDLRDDHIRHAKSFGCRFVIDTDAHGPSRLDRMRLGVGTAQRGWLTAQEVINTWPIEKLLGFLAKKKG